jgi:dolichol-phosphate mannosyltransferase
VTAVGGGRGEPPRGSPVALSVVLPTYNEAENLPDVIEHLEGALHGLAYEIIVVDDDSSDGTWMLARRLAATRPHLLVIRRVGRRGLSSAVLEGFLAARGDVLAVADADGQHDVGLLPDLYSSVCAGASVAVGSRYVAGGSLGALAPRRRAMSRVATQITRVLGRTGVQDPLSGFFAIDRRTFESTLPRLRARGFKILLEILLHLPPGACVREVPMAFGARRHGRSKLSGHVQLEFLESLYEATLGRFIPVTLVKYCAVGGLGVAVHALVYLVITRGLLGDDRPALLGFSLGVLAAIEVAIAFNFTLNNAWTFAHVRLRGRRAAIGFLKFNVACLLGALANYGVSALLYLHAWPEAAAVGLGAAVGTSWNYTINRVYTWGSA